MCVKPVFSDAMSELLFGYTTSKGTTFKKVRDKNGVTRYFKDGTPVKQQSWAGGQESFSKPVLDDSGNLPGAVRDASTAQELERLTNIPFTRDTLSPIGGDESTKESALRAESNRFLGFWNANDHLDREEAAKEYLKFRNEIEGVKNGSARAAIRNSYNLGGS